MRTVVLLFKPDQKPGPEFRAQHSGYNSPITGCGFRFKECFLFRDSAAVYAPFFLLQASILNGRKSFGVPK